MFPCGISHQNYTFILGVFTLIIFYLLFLDGLNVSNFCLIRSQYNLGRVELLFFPFICWQYNHLRRFRLNYLLFQSTLVCSFPLDALPCEEAPNFFEGPDSINSRFGVVEDKKEE